MTIAAGGLCGGSPTFDCVMTVNEATIPDEAQSGATPLELLADDDGVWTAVPADASGDERVSKWLSVDEAALCDLEEWR